MQLGLDLEEAAHAFASSEHHAERLYALMRAMGAITEAFRDEPEIREHMLPFVALIEAMDHLVNGYRNALLRPCLIKGRPKGSGTRIVEQVAGVFAAQYLRSSGLTAAAADRASAHMLAGNGVIGKSGNAVTQRTITDWRLAASQSRGSPLVREQVALFFKPPHPMATPQHVLEEATAAVAQILATRARKITE